MSDSLFRPQALAHRNVQHLGSIVLLRPLSLQLLTWVAGCIAALVIAFLWFAQYTQKTSVSGVLMPRQGVIAVLAPRSGTIRERRVEEGQEVRQGEVLFVLSAERRSTLRGDTQAEISRHVAARRDMLVQELQQQRDLQREEHEALLGKIANLEIERQQLEAQILTEARRQRSLAETLAQFEKLREQGFVSAVQLQEKRDLTLEREAELHSLERNRAALARELGDGRAALAAQPLKWRTSLSGVEREIARVEQELSESEAQRELTITAAQGGIVTALAVQTGQSVTTDTALASIVPSGSVLEAQLYAPSRAVGFIEPGQPVQLRYPAFPYEKFGPHAGTVTSVSRATLPGSGSVAAGALSGPAANAQAMYRITVSLRSQTVKAYGREQPLRAGMQVNAAVQLERRRVMEWILEPLYSVSGQF